MGIKHIRLKFNGDEPLRLDNYLAGELEEYSRSFVKKMISEGGVSVGGKAAKPSRLLQRGEEVVVRMEPPKPLSTAPEEIPVSILFEDEYLLVVDKPAGMVVHPAPGHPGGTLVNALLFYCKDLSGIGGKLRPGIVHRLDAGTSGVIAVAKSDAAHVALSEQFKAREVRKSYATVVFGCPSDDIGEVDVPIGRDRRNRKKISAATEKPREAISRYEVTESFSEFAYLNVSLLTGRTHQVRVHMAHIGHPLVGDSLYGGGRWMGVANKQLRSLARSFGRPALHAASIEFRHPIDGRTVHVESPLPKDFNCLLTALRKEASQ